MGSFDVNWIAIIAAAACGFLVGGIWYGPVMGKRWMGAVGLTEEEIKDGNMALFFIDAAYWLLFYTAMGIVHALL